MARQSIRNGIRGLAAVFVVLVVLAAGIGCDDAVVAGDFMEPSVAPADFSPHGYDYTVYDILTGNT